MKRWMSALLTGVSALALIGTASRSAVTVKATVVADCSLQSPQMIDFGTYDPATTTTIDVTTEALQIQCTKGSPGVSIALDNGQYYTGTHRSMRTTGGNGSVDYEIYTASTRSVIWNRTQTVLYSSVGRQFVRIPLYGRVLGAHSPAPGDYSDTLTALVNF
jgi:spore coat protein U-like protein